MSRGLECFVSASVLFTFDPVKLSKLSVWPGSPQRRVAVIDGKALPVTSYPAAGFFLQTLKATCDRVVIIAPWAPDRTSALLHIFGWNSFDETRTICSVPGQDTLNLTSVGGSLDKLSYSIVVTESNAAWDPMLHSQIIETRHEESTPQSSFALLRVLSACIRIAECKVRFPQTAVSACATLCRVGLFANCRFCLSPQLEEPWLVALMIAQHGGYIVLSRENATHYIITDELTSMKTKTELQTIVSDQGDKKDFTNGTDPNMEEAEDDLEVVAARDEENGDEESVEEELFADDFNFEGSQNAKIADAGTAPNAGQINWESKNNNDDEEASGLSGEGGDLNNSLPITATRRWVRDCCEGIQLYPPQTVFMSNSNESLWTTALLLAALLPPPDAEPLRLSRFNAIATANGFESLTLSQTYNLQQLWGGSLCVEPDDEADDWFLSRPERSSIEGGAEFARHLEFVAEQFCDAWEGVMRGRRRLGTTDTGTQTAVTVTASTAMNTDAVERPAEPTGRALLLRALGPADWAREIGGGAVASAPTQLRAAERTEASGATALSEPTAARDAPQSAVPGDSESANDTKQKVPSPTYPDNNANEEGVPDFTKCFISTELLGERSDLLERDSLLRQFPFRKYPMKVSIEKRGIHCSFASTIDARSFCREKFAEVQNQSLPIVPEYDDDRSSVPDYRKRRRSRSPPAPKPSGSNSFQTKMNRREATAALQRTVNEGWDLSKSDLDLLDSIGATYEYALQNVNTLEHYVSHDLKDPAFRKQKQQLINIIEKLKRIKKNAV